jgi:nucleotide-binding universal stress UspA family protein
MNSRTLLLACENPGDADRFSAALNALETQGQGPCRIVLLHVVEKIFPVATLASLGGGLMVPPPPTEAERQWEEARQEEARVQLSHLRTLLPADWPVTVRVEHGPPAETICRVAGSEQADLILLAGHPRCRVRRWLLGRTARRVVDNAPCHVLVLGPAVAEPVRRTPRRPVSRSQPRWSESSPAAPPLCAPPGRA